MRKRILWLVSGLAALILATTPALSFAVDSGSSGSEKTGDSTSSSEVTTEDGTDTDRNTEHPTTTNVQKEVAEAKLQDVKLKVCRLHENQISNVITRSSDRAEAQLNLFSTIATRVEDFYQKKGKTVANYDELKAAVDAAHSKATTDLATLKQTNTFSCDGDNPKGHAQAFKAALEQERQDLQDYRTAVKNLIRAVRQAQGTTSSEQGGSND